MEAYPEYTFKIMHTTQNQYYIQNVETEKYLAVTFKTAGKSRKRKCRKVCCLLDEAAGQDLWAVPVTAVKWSIFHSECEK